MNCVVGQRRTSSGMVMTKRRVQSRSTRTGAHKSRYERIKATAFWRNSSFNIESTRRRHRYGRQHPSAGTCVLCFRLATASPMPGIAQNKPANHHPDPRNNSRGHNRNDRSACCQRHY
ncbi:hypothetical protein MRX96_058657 [Rhipicephalus microplus]